MVGWDDDASHSQVICPSEKSESIMCSNLPGGMLKKCKNVCNSIPYNFWSEINNKISHLKDLQRTTLDGPSALAFT